MVLPEIRLVEVGPRDGLQSLAAAVSVEDKIAFIDALSETGLREIEAGAFVSSKAVPQMAGSEEVFTRIKRKAGVVYSALVPNEEGLERAVKARADKVAVFTAASETFNRKNINASIAESIERFRPVVNRARLLRLPVRGYVSTAFHCPYEGPVSPLKTIGVVESLLALGVGEFSIGDTIGKASPSDVRGLLPLLLGVLEPDKIFLHFHDTHGMAVANALTSWREFGVGGFDASAGGIGGCPFAPGAGGNVATEKLIFAFEAEGARTGADREKVSQAALILKGGRK